MPIIAAKRLPCRDLQGSPLVVRRGLFVARRHREDIHPQRREGVRQAVHVEEVAALGDIVEHEGIEGREVRRGVGVERGQGRVRRGREGAWVRQGLGWWDVQRHRGGLHGGREGGC